MSLLSCMKRTFLKKWYKFQQNQKQKNFDSHWYIRFGWLNEPLNHHDQLKNLFEIHSPKKFTFADCFYVENQGRHFIFFDKESSPITVSFYFIFIIQMQAPELLRFPV